MIRKRCFTALFVLGVAAPGALAQDAPASPLAGLSFMAGCWAGTFDYRGEPGVIEERYTVPAGSAMLGQTRYLGGGRVVHFEFTSILIVRNEIVLTPYPNGDRSEHGFTATSVTENEAVFEAPEHDFPKRIIYRRDGDVLTAHIDGGADSDRAQSWELRPTSCEM